MKILSPLVGISFAYVKNSKEFASFISTQKIDINSILVSFDVVSLFTSISIDRAIEVARKRIFIEELACQISLHNIGRLIKSY